MTILALVLGSVAVILSVILPIFLADRTLRSAFNTLEDDFETLRQSVRSDLGRVSRLKRSIMHGEVPTEEGAGAVQVPDGNGPPSLSQRQMEWQKKILSRRRTV